MSEPKPTTTLVRVVAPHFVAGLIIGRNERCTEAAPILNWAINKSRSELQSYFARKGWKASVINGR